MNKSKKGLSGSIKLLIFWINLLIIYVFSGFQILLYFILIPAVGYFIIKLIAYLRLPDQEKDINKDALWLSLKYLKISRKYILASILGLMLAVLILSQTFLVSDSILQAEFERQFEEGYGSGTISLYSDSMGSTVSSLSDYNEMTAELSDIATEVVTKRGYQINNIISNLEKNFQVRVEGLDEGGDNTDFTSFYLLTPQIHNAIDQSSSLSLDSPYHDNLTLVFRGYSDHAQIDIEDNKLSVVEDDGDGDMEYQLGVDAQINCRCLQESRVYSDILQLNQPMYSDIVFVAENIFFNILEWRSQPNLRTSIFVDAPPYYEVDTATLMNDFNAIEQELRNDLSMAGYHDIEIEIPIYYSIQEINFLITSIRLSLLFAVAPVLVLGLYLVYFSVNLVQSRKRRYFSIMRVRGASDNQILSMQYIEVLTAALIASGVGMLLSIPWVALALRTSGYFEFNGPPVDLYITTEWLWKMPILGILLAFDLNIANIINLRNVTIEEGDNPEERTKPFWQRIYLDVTLFVLGMVEYIFLKVVPLDPNTSFIFLPFIFLLAPFSILGITLGSVLIVSRYFGDIVGKVSDYLWIKRGDLFALATRNIRKNKFSSSRLASLLVFGLIVSFSYTVVPSTIEGMAQESIRYDLGADMVIKNFDDPGLEQQIEAFEEVQTTTMVREVQLSSFADSHSQTTILAVNPDTFADTAFWRSNYASESLDTLMEQLAEGEILLNNRNMDYLDLEIGDRFSINARGSTISREIGGTFDFFPRLLDYQPYSSEQRYVVISLAAVESSLSSLSESIQSILYIDLGDSVNQTIFADSLTEILPESMTVDFVEAGQAYQSTDIGLLIGVVQSMLIISLAVSFVGIGYFSFITLAERRKEIGIFRALGMVKSQIFKLLMVESFIILGTAYVMGTLLGFILTDFLVQLVTIDSGAPPLRLFFPWVVLIGFYILLAVVSVIAVYIPASRESERQAGSVIRAE